MTETFPRTDFRALLAALIGVPISFASGANAADPGSFWLRFHGLQEWEWGIDHDGDGRDAWEEYIAGTDPHSPDSRLALSVAWEGADLLLSWQTQPGVAYQPESSLALDGFDPLGGVIDGDGGAFELQVVPDDENQMFYRLAALPPTDADGDGLSSVEEGILGTLPGDDDTDGDGRLDGDEVFLFASDPLVFDAPGGTISGTVLTDPNGDGDLTDGSPMENVTVYLDANFNRQLDPGERRVTTGVDGGYEFLQVPPGVYHVRQLVVAPSLQTAPSPGLVPIDDYLPDEVVSYVHAAPGEGNFDAAYGETAEGLPAAWNEVDLTSGPKLLPDLDLLLAPIGFRSQSAGALLLNGTAFLSLPTGAAVVLRFDETIVDGPGPDLIIHTIANGAGEMARLSVGPDAGSLTEIATLEESSLDGRLMIDLHDFGYTQPVRVLRIEGLDNLGGYAGFELVGVEALHVSPASPDAHVVTLASGQVAAGLDFGQLFRDLPPHLVLSIQSGGQGMPRVGDTVIAQVAATDDAGITSRSLSLNGAPVALDADGTASVVLPGAGIATFDASATDTGGQTVNDRVLLYVANADGSSPDPSLTGAGQVSPVGAPGVRIVGPEIGANVTADTPIIANIEGDPAPLIWTLEYARVDDIDPYDLLASDPDYVSIGSGSGNLYSAAAGVFPASSLPDGIYFLRLCASNSPGIFSCFGQVIAKNVDPAALQPQITIDAFTDTDPVMLTRAITGGIASARPLHEWFAEIAPADEVDLNDLGSDAPNWVRLNEGTAAFAGGAFAELDATRLKNGSYIVRIVARNDIGLGRVEGVPIEIAGEAKLGRLRLEFTDLDIRVPGFSLGFTRAYDSLRADEDGPLGFGWSLDLLDPDIRETVPDTGVAGVFGATPFREGTRVYLTAPDGSRLGFTFHAEPGAASGFGSVYRATFVPDPGVYHRLEVPEGDLAFLDLRPSGEIQLFFFSLPYNPSRYVLIDPDGTRYTYDENEGFLEARDANGNTLTMQPDGLVHSGGLGIAITRNGSGRIESITAPDGGQHHFSYDGDGNLASVTDPDGAVTTYDYLGDPDHYLESITDPLGRMPMRYEYDADGRLAAIIDESGNRREVTWDPAGFTGSRTDGRGNTTQLEYDARGNVTRSVDPLGGETRYEYADAANPDRQTAIEDAVGARHEYTWTALGKIANYKPPEASSFFGFDQVQAEYDAEGNLTRFLDGKGGEWTYSYDAAGNTTSVTSPFRASEVNTFASDGRLIASADAGGFQESISYDAKGHIAGVADISGFSMGLQMTPNRMPAGATFAGGGNYSFSYTHGGIPTTQTGPDSTSVDIAEQPDGSFSRSERSGASSSVALDADGRATSATLPGGETLGISYDANRNLSALEDPMGHTTSFAYDQRNNLSDITDAGGRTTSFSVNAIGLVTEIIDRNGKRRTFGYDGNRRLVRESWHDGGGAVIKEYTFTYGDLGLETATDGTMTHTFIGGAVRPSRIDFAFPGQDFWALNYSWEQNGDPQPAPTNIAVVNGFLPAGQIGQLYFGGKTARLTWDHPGDSGNSIEFHRNAANKVAEVRRFTTGGNISPISRTLTGYDANGRVTSIRHENGSGSLAFPQADLAYTRDADGKVTAVVNAADSATYTYDAAGQLASATHTGPAFPAESYTYDVCGNRLSSHLIAGPTVVEAGNRLRSAGSFTFTYDAEGNLIERTDTGSGKVTRFEYDHRQRLVLATVHPSAAAPADVTLEFEYDFINRMVSRRRNGGPKTWILHDRLMPIAEFEDGASTLSAFHLYALDGIDQRHAVWRAGVGEHWFLRDNLGSIRGIIDDSGAPISWTDYDAFGNVLGTPAPGLEEIRFAGRPFIEDLGLYQNRRRLYDPMLGRFTQEDRMGYQGGDFNVYRYVNNQPLHFIDPLGSVAALEEGLLDALIARVEIFCKFGDCVGNLWSGVVRATVNHEQVDAIGSAIACAIDTIPSPVPAAFCDPIGELQNAILEGSEEYLINEIVGENGGKVLKIIELVQTCTEATRIKFEEVPEPEPCSLRSFIQK